MYEGENADLSRGDAVDDNVRHIALANGLPVGPEYLATEPEKVGRH